MTSQTISKAIVEYGRNASELQLATLAGFNPDEMRMLKIFWRPAFNDGWILLQDDIILGQMTIQTNKNALSRFYEMLTEEYQENIDYKKINHNHELVQLYYQTDSTESMESIDITKLGAKHYYAVTGETYKDLLARASTKKGRVCRSYYRKVEGLAIIMRDYIMELGRQDLVLANAQILSQQTTIATARTANKELIQLNTIREKSESIYVVSNSAYAKRGLFKVGRTKQRASTRLSSLNTGLPKPESLVILNETKTHNATQLEYRIHYVLDKTRESSDREYFKIPFLVLVEIINAVTTNMEKEIDNINNLVLKSYDLDNLDKGPDFWASGLVFDEEPSASEPAPASAYTPPHIRTCSGACIYTPHIRTCCACIERGRNQKKNYVRIYSRNVWAYQLHI